MVEGPLGWLLRLNMNGDHSGRFLADVQIRNDALPFHFRRWIMGFKAGRAESN